MELMVHTFKQSQFTEGIQMYSRKHDESICVINDKKQWQF